MRCALWYCLSLLAAVGTFVAAGTIIHAQKTPDRELLLHPKALAPQPRAVDPLEFRDPPVEYRSMPLWVWNDEMQWPRLAEQLKQFKEQGIGGVFIHPRPGLMTEYLGDEWFRLWKASAEEGKRLGLLVNIYDENSYPSGFAGGHVPSLAPDTASQFVEADPDASPNRIGPVRAGSLGAFAVKKDASGATTAFRRVWSRADLLPGESVAAFTLRRAGGNPWTAGFPYVDLTNPETARAFIQTTFEAYKKNIGGEFGKTVRWAFDDEPLLATGGAYDQARLALPLSYNTLAEFRARNGYDLLDVLPSLYWDAGDFRKVRFDYWQTLHDLWKENYFRPIFDWSDRNNIQFTGHWMEHEWPYPFISPDDASLYAYEHVPGIDMLEGSNIRTRGSDPHMLFTIKQVASVAHQLGRRVFCEAYGVAGWDSTFEHYKRFGDWLMVHGVNFMDQHLAFSTVRGARKRDHPQSFTDVSPWWPYYRLHADHLARVSYMLSRSQSRNRIVLLEPTTTGFLYARRAGRTPELEAMRTENAALIQFLADHQQDFDLADEYMLEWFGEQDGRKLRIGQAVYDLLVWPAHMENVRRQTLPHLEQYLAAGGEVLALGPPASYVDGRLSGAVAELARRYAAQWHSVTSHPELLNEIRGRLPASVLLDRDLPNVGMAERYLDDGRRVLFFANTGLTAVKATATVKGGRLQQWDTVTGQIRAAHFQASEGRLRFQLDLPPAGSALFAVTPAMLYEDREALAVGTADDFPAFRPVQAGRWAIRTEALNVLVLDYCDFTAPGVELRDVNTWRANWLLWGAHGFERPAWDNAVQFKTRVFDRNQFAPDSGFQAVFRFDVADAAALRGLELAVELPELYRVAVNGTLVSFAQAPRWLDPHIRSLPIEKLARPGENFIAITGRPFDVRMEFENIYLRGNFSLTPVEKGFRLGTPVQLNFGGWAGQGYPFYGQSVLYETQIEAAPGNRTAKIELPGWQASVAEVLLDGARAALIGWPPYETQFPISPGPHTVGVRVVSTPRNTFGPFHNPQKPRMRAWPDAWAQFPEHQPAGAQYDVLDYGLMEAPRISVRN